MSSVKTDQTTFCQVLYEKKNHLITQHVINLHLNTILYCQLYKYFYYNKILYLILQNFRFNLLNSKHIFPKILHKSSTQIKYKNIYLSVYRYYILYRYMADRKNKQCFKNCIIFFFLTLGKVAASSQLWKKKQQ